MNHRLNLVFILCWGILSGCPNTKKSPTSFSPQDLIINKINRTAPAHLTADQVRSDVAFLEYALTRGYGGRHYVPQDKFSEALRRLRTIPASATPTELKDEIDTALLLIPDRHLKARLDGSPSPARRASEKKGHVGRNARHDPEKIWEVRLDRQDKARLLYISIAHFPSGKDPVWNGFLESVQSKLAQSDRIVLDLRGNGGGDDERGYALAKLLLGHDVVSPVEKQIYSQTPETFAIAKNGYLIARLRAITQGKPVPDYLTQQIREQDENFNLALEKKLPEERVETHQQDHSLAKQVAYAKPIFILMDGECASSCESTIDAFETHPTVKRVGENTAGYLHFGNIGQLVLPYSRINVQIPTKYDQYFDHRFIEGIGLTPDIRVSPGTDAYDVIRGSRFE